MLLQIYTVTYNRPEQLERLYHSLLKLKPVATVEFLWLVVYNGMPELVRQVHEKIQYQNKISYDAIILEKNLGLTPALNVAHKALKGRYALRIDDDDIILDTALEIIASIIQRLDADETLSGALFDMVDKDGNTIGDPLSDFPEQASNFTYQYRLKLKGDKARLYKTDLIKLQFYPVFKGELYVLDSYVYYRIDHHYKLVAVPKPLIERSYYDDGITLNAAKTITQNPRGIIAYYNALLTHPETNVFDRLVFNLMTIAIAKRIQLNIKEARVLLKDTPRINCLIWWAYPLLSIYFRLKRKRSTM